MSPDEWIKARLEEIELLKKAYDRMPEHVNPFKADRLRDLEAEEIVLRNDLKQAEAGL